MDVNFCYHHIPAWSPPTTYQTDVYCSAARQTQPHRQVYL